jgi:hypothetical protein
LYKDLKARFLKKSINCLSFGVFLQNNLYKPNFSIELCSNRIQIISYIEGYSLKHYAKNKNLESMTGSYLNILSFIYTTEDQLSNCLKYIIRL